MPECLYDIENWFCRYLMNFVLMSVDMRIYNFVYIFTRMKIRFRAEPIEQMRGEGETGLVRAKYGPYWHRDTGEIWWRKLQLLER